MGGHQETHDAIQYAYQLGRLDFVTLVLAVLALFIGVSAFPLFGYLKARAERVAKDEAKSALDEAIKEIEAKAIAYTEEMLPTLFREYAEFVQQVVNNDMADQIAGAQEDENADGVRKG